MDLQSRKHSDHHDRTNYVFIAIVTGAILVWAAWGLGVAEWTLNRWGPAPSGTGDADRLGRLGMFGDVFGGVNALFTALAFAGVIWTAVLQRKELQAQREELQQTREVLREQSDALSQQAFDSIFFELLRLCRETSEKIMAKVDGKFTGHSGELALMDLDARLYDEVAVRSSSWYEKEIQLIKQEIETLYSDQIYKPNEQWLGPYFRSLYHLFKLIDRRRDISEEKKVEYANIARAHLSKEALFLLAINVCTARGQEFRPLVERYGLLKHMERLEIRWLLLRILSEDAFESHEGRQRRRLEQK